MQRKTVKRDESAQKIHPRPTRDSVSRRASVGAARACGARVFYVRCTSARMTRGITAKSAPKSAQICVPAQIFWNALPQFRWKNNVIRFRILKIHPLFAHRRRSTENSPVSPMRPISAAKARSRRGTGTRVIYVRGTSARGITAKFPRNLPRYARCAGAFEMPHPNSVGKTT